MEYICLSHIKGKIRNGYSTNTNFNRYFKMNLRYEDRFINGLLGLEVLVKLGVNINLKELIIEFK